MIKTSGGSDKFIPESLRGLDFTQFMNSKTTRTNFGNLVDVDEEDDQKN